MKSSDTIILDKECHLRVYSPSGRLLVKSDDYYGQDPRVITVGVRDQIPGAHNSTGDPQPVGFRGRLTLTQTGDTRYLLVPKNYPFGGSALAGVSIVENSSLVFLSIDREGLRRVYESRKQKGYLATYLVTDTPDPKTRRLHLVHVGAEEGILGLGKKTSTVFTYRW